VKTTPKKNPQTEPEQVKIPKLQTTSKTTTVEMQTLKLQISTDLRKNQKIKAYTNQTTKRTTETPKENGGDTDDDGKRSSKAAGIKGLTTSTGLRRWCGAKELVAPPPEKLHREI
jgi:hypothetical protein